MRPGDAVTAKSVICQPHILGILGSCLTLPLTGGIYEDKVITCGQCGHTFTKTTHDDTRLAACPACETTNIWTGDQEWP